jgi:hypothetical protein
MQRSILMGSVLVLALFGLVPAGWSQQPLADTLTILQDEPLELPEDNRAYVSATRTLTVQLDTLAAVEGLDDALVTLIRPSGVTTQYEPNENLEITLDELESGPHALVASSRQAHGTMLLDVLETPPAEVVPAPDQAVEAAEPAPPARKRMTLLAVRGSQLLPFVEDMRDYGLAGPLDADALVAASARWKSGQAFNFKVLLTEDGTLLGRVITIWNETDVSVEGTNIVIFRDGRRVGSTTCDAEGLWSMGGMQAGVYGLIASGQAGYAAFAFETVDAVGVVMRNSRGERFASQVQPQPVIDRLPVVLCPPPFLDEIEETITDYYPMLQTVQEPLSTAGQPIATPAGGAMVSGPSTASGPGGGGGGGAGAAGGGGFGSVVGLAALGAAAAAGSGGSGSLPVIASPSVPVPSPLPPSSP